MDKPGFKKLMEALRARIHYTETNGGDYKAVNKDTGALGKYQFHPKHWWKSIQQFAKKAGYGSITEEDFKNNGQIQEEFFEQEYMPKVYSFVKEQAKHNKRNLDLDEIAQLYHLNPSKAKAYVRGGSFSKDQYNPDGPEYLKKGKNSIDRLSQKISGFEHRPVRNGDLMTEEARAAAANDYISQLEAIQNSSDTKGAKALKVRQLKQQAYNNGLNNVINNELNSRLQKFDDEKMMFSQLYGEMKENIEKKSSAGRPYYHFQIDSNKGKALLDKLIEKNPELAKDVHKTKNGKYTVNLGLKNAGSGKLNAFTNYFVDSAKKFADTDITSLDELVNDRKMPLFPSAVGGPQLDLSDELVDLDFNKSPFDPTTYSIANTDVDVREKDYTNPEDVKKTETAQAKEKESQPVTDVQDVVMTPTAEPNNSLDAFLQNQVPLNEPDNLEYDKNNFEKEIPFEAAASAVIGALGIEQSNTDVPLRTEQVSQGVMDFARKMGELSKMGLPPSLEAKLKNDNAQAYSLMMNNIVEASGGNRNLVLANQGQLDYNRMLANNDIALADFEQKQLALEKFGQVQQYINEFRARRDISNTQVQQELALDRRQDGEELAFAGFSAMSDALREAEMYGPGSANHMLMSQIRQEAFGFDPEMKDDGSGTVPGTRSYYMKTVVEPIRANNDNIKFIKSEVPNLNEGQSKFLNLVTSNTNDAGTVKNALEFVKNTDPSRINENNIGVALESNDFGKMLFNEMDEKNFLSEAKANEYDLKNFVS